MFQSPEGDSLFFYDSRVWWWSGASLSVSVPRRGFIVFLPQRMLADAMRRLLGRFQSPEGDSLFFYPCFTSRFGRSPHSTTTVTLVCSMKIPPFWAEAPLRPHFFKIRASPPTPKTREMLGFFATSPLSVTLSPISPTTSSGGRLHFPSIAKTPPTPLDARIFTLLWPRALRAAPPPHW